MSASYSAYLDQLSLWTVIGLLLPWGLIRALKRRGILTIYYFGSSSRARKLASALDSALPIRCRELDYSIAEVSDTNGAQTYAKVTSDDVLDVVAECSRQVLESHPLVGRIGRRFANQRFLIYLKRSIDLELRRAFFELSVVEWHHRTSQAESISGPIMFVARSTWFSFSRSYAGEQGVQLRSYWRLAGPRLPRWRRWVPRMLRNSRANLRRLARTARPDGKKLPEQAQPGNLEAESSQTAMPVIATPFDGDGVTVDSGYNSDLFWFPFSNAAPGQVLLYSWLGLDPLDDEKVSILDGAGVRYVAMSPASATSQRVPLWTPSRDFAKQFARLALWCAGQFLLSIWRRPPKLGWLLPRLFDFVFDYAYWHDFFRTNNVKVHLTRPGRRIAAEQALADLGGISATYQRSCTFFPSAHQAYTSDVHFSFSPEDASILRQSGACIGQVVATGYVHDYGFTEVAIRANKLRCKLQEKGARFIICFFDENSDSDRKKAHVTHEQAADNYRYLLDRLGDDPGLGVIFKPKKPATLDERLGEVSNKLNAAVNEGRCYVFGKGGVNSVTLPCEASLAADVTIGMLVGATAALESRLAGTPSVLLDPEHVTYHPMYSLGPGSVVFEGWDELWQSLLPYRQDPSANPRFGDWGPVSASADPFRDGRAAERIGAYLGCLATGLRSGLSRDLVLDQARQNYGDIWGKDKVAQLVH